MLITMDGRLVTSNDKDERFVVSILRVVFLIANLSLSSSPNLRPRPPPPPQPYVNCLIPTAVGQANLLRLVYSFSYGKARYMGKDKFDYMCFSAETSFQEIE